MWQKEQKHIYAMEKSYLSQYNCLKYSGNLNPAEAFLGCSDENPRRGGEDLPPAKRGLTMSVPCSFRLGCLLSGWHNGETTQPKAAINTSDDKIKVGVRVVLQQSELGQPGQCVLCSSSFLTKSE